MAKMLPALLSLSASLAQNVDRPVLPAMTMHGPLKPGNRIPAPRPGPVISAHISPSTIVFGLCGSALTPPLVDPIGSTTKAHRSVLSYADVGTYEANLGG